MEINALGKHIQIASKLNKVKTSTFTRTTGIPDQFGTPDHYRVTMHPNEPQFEIHKAFRTQKTCKCNVFNERVMIKGNGRIAS